MWLYIEAKIANTEAIVKYNMCVCVYCTPHSDTRKTAAQVP